jgi:ADP-ribosylation factor-binding protein GGA
LTFCVKNCGYAFHLQVSTKDFLNELVRRFPERPPIRVTRVQNRILELIEEWRSTICVTSKYREDLGFIRDMHRLLSYKGYTFPAVKREDAAVLNPTNDLRSAEEMEEEERAAQSAKLQELIRRGTPHDLQEANKLMKIMAGFDTRRKTDYRAKAAEEVSKVQQKARILEEMLQGYKPGDEIQEGDVFEVSTTSRCVVLFHVDDIRNSQTPWPVRTQRSKKCARKSLRTTRLSPSCSKSTIVFTVRAKDTS